MADEFLIPENPKIELRRYLQMIEADPDDAISYQRLGQCYYAIGNYQEAARASIRALEIESRLVIPHVLLAYLYYREGKHADSVMEATKAYNLSPELPPVLDCYGTILLSTGKANEAIPFLKRAIDKNPSLLSARNNLAMAYRQIGNHKFSLVEIKEIYKLNPSSKHLLKLMLAYERWLALPIAITAVLVIVIGIKIKSLLIFPALFVIQGWWMGLQLIKDHKSVKGLIYISAYSILAIILLLIYYLPR